MNRSKLWQQNFSFCPGCGSGDLQHSQPSRYECPVCGYLYYQNSASACGAIIEIGDRMLLLQRAKDPQKGFWDLPGGFVDPGESLEEALKREVLEETGLILDRAQFFMSLPNSYVFRGIEYPTCDSIFIGKIEADDPAITLQAEEISGSLLLHPSELEPEHIAFPSIRTALCAYRDMNLQRS